MVVVTSIGASFRTTGREGARSRFPHALTDAQRICWRTHLVTSETAELSSLMSTNGAMHASGSAHETGLATPFAVSSYCWWMQPTVDFNKILL